MNKNIISNIIIGIFIGLILSTIDIHPEETRYSIEEMKEAISELTEEIDSLSTYVDEDRYYKSLLKNIKFVTNDNKIHYYDCDVVIYRNESGEKFKIYTDEELSLHPEFTFCNDCSWYWEE